MDILQNENLSDNTKSSNIDENLYSRQIILFGIETMTKISKLKILIIGLRGLGIEIAKDIIVSGPNKVIVFDPNKVESRDLGSNFYLSEKDIGKRRDESCINKLKKLNKYVNVDYFEENSIENIISKIVDNFNVIVVSEIIQKKYILLLDGISRKNNICLIYSAVIGMSSFIFNDFGENFTIFDEFCLKKRKFSIKNIENSEKGLVIIESNNKNENIQDYVIFKEVEGMTEINFSESNKKIFKIEQKDQNSFYIGNTLNYGIYKCGGYVEETSNPKIIKHKNFEENLNEPFPNNNNDYTNPKKKFIFLVFLSLMEFFDKKERLPFLNNIQDYEEIKAITEKIFKNLNYEKSLSFEKDELIFNEDIIKNICFTSSTEIPCMTSFTGGVVCQEIIKVTGKYRPIEQWKIFDFLQYSSIIPYEERFIENIENSKYKESKYIELITIFGEKIINKLQNLTIFLAGAGALGCELLKNLALFGIKFPGSVHVIDDDNIEISNLNRQILFHEEDKGKSKAYIACISAKEINNDLNCNFISKRISPENNNIFYDSSFENVDFVLGAIDSKMGNYYLSKQCELYEKILIKGGTGGPTGKVESFIPNMTYSYNNIAYRGEPEEKLPSCTRREFPRKIEDCIDNSRDLFDEYFNILIVDLLKIINGKEKLMKIEVENSINKFNILNIFLYFFINVNNKIVTIFLQKLINYFGIKFQIKAFLDEEEEKLFIKFGLEEFYKLFTKDVEKIFIEHPLNETEESKTFWQNKKIPKKIEFNIEDEQCINFLFSFLKITSQLLQINFRFDKYSFKLKLNEILKNQKNKEKEQLFSYITDPELLYQKTLNYINEIKNNTFLLDKVNNLKKIDFEKDVPEFGHIEFIHNYTNLKAKSYNIPKCDKFYTLEYVGKIGPTTITSTSVVAGYMCIQMMGIIANQMYIWPKKGYKLDSYENEDIDEEELIENGLHDFTFNLKKNMFDFEPFKEIKYDGFWDINKLIPEKYSRWFKILERGDNINSINEFNMFIKQKYGVDVTLILSAEDDRDIYKKVKIKNKNRISKIKLKQMEEMEKISKLRLEDVYFNSSLEKYKTKNKNIFLKLQGITNNGDFIEFPVIKYQI